MNFDRRRCQVPQLRQKEYRLSRNSHTFSGCADMMRDTIPVDATLCFTRARETPLSHIFRRLFILVLAVVTAIAGCATSTGTTRENQQFSNLLVMGVAGSWDSRAQFERAVVSGLRAEGISARSYNVLVPGGKAPTRDDVLALVDEHGFDAVVVTRLLDAERDVEMHSGVTGAKIRRKESGFLKLFRYDYEELGDPIEITVNTEVDFVTELYSAATEGVVWTAHTQPQESDNVALLIDNSAKLVVQELRRSGKLGR